MYPGEMKTCHPETARSIHSSHKADNPSVYRQKRGQTKRLIQARERSSPQWRGALTQKAVCALQTLSSGGASRAPRPQTTRPAGVNIQAR